MLALRQLRGGKRRIRAFNAHPDRARRLDRYLLTENRARQRDKWIAPLMRRRRLKQRDQFFQNPVAVTQFCARLRPIGGGSACGRGLWRARRNGYSGQKAMMASLQPRHSV